MLSGNSQIILFYVGTAQFSLTDLQGIPIHKIFHLFYILSNTWYYQVVLILAILNGMPKKILLSWIGGEGNGTPLQYSCLENPMDGGAWWAAVHGVAQSQTRLSDFTFTFHFHALENEMAIHSSVLAWRIPGMGKPSGLLSMGSHRVGHDWSDLAAASWIGGYIYIK